MSESTATILVIAGAILFVGGCALSLIWPHTTLVIGIGAILLSIGAWNREGGVLHSNDHLDEPWD